MAYIFSAEKRDEQDLQILHERLSGFNLIEFFPIDVSDESVVLGISIPRKAMDDPNFDNELNEAMNYLVSERGFQVTDLFTGRTITPGDLPGLAQQISG